MGMEGGLVGGGPPWWRLTVLSALVGMVVVGVSWFERLRWTIMKIVVAPRGGKLAPVAGVLESLARTKSRVVMGG